MNTLKVTWTYLRNHYAEVYRVLLFALAAALLILMFPKEATFKYEFRKGKYWMHEDLVAPFDFAILKTEQELKTEKDTLLSVHKPFFTFDAGIADVKKKEFISRYEALKSTVYSGDETKWKIDFRICLNVLDSLFKAGIIESVTAIENKSPDFGIMVLKDNIAYEKELGLLFTIASADQFIRNKLSQGTLTDYQTSVRLLEESLAQNLRYDAVTTEKDRKNILGSVSLTKGMLETGQSIIAKGELITADKYQVLESLKKEYELQLGSNTRYYAVVIGQLLLLASAMIVLFLFLNSFRRDILINNKKIVFILLVVLLMVLVTSLVVHNFVNLIYLVPLCLVPLIIRVFFDTRLALFVHLVTIIIIGFLVPNSFEFVFLQLIAGILTIISVAKLQKRAQFFLTSLLIFLAYTILYIGMTLIQDGNLVEIDFTRIALYGGSAMMTLFAYPLIFVFEKLFGLVTDISLMELTDSNSKLLRELASKAPGTFQHSIQVANIAEEVVREIGGDALLVRAGAMYHDIGKSDMPLFFIENQVTGINPHDDLSPEESATVIISHVIKGIEVARKHKIPDQIIDFIRTHHGTRRTDFFYSKHMKDFPELEVEESKFRYNGPIPFSKETAVLMMVDSVEAASRSLKLPSVDALNRLVDNVIDHQIESGQFSNADVTFRDIDKIKRILKKKLLSIYHVRVEYPQLS